MNKDIFRKNSLERLSSPENLSEYLRVANPGMWIVLITVIVVLAGIFAIGYIKPISINRSYGAICEDGVAYVYFPGDDVDGIDVGCEVTIEGNIYHIERFLEYSGDDSSLTVLDKGAMDISGIDKNAPVCFGVFNADVPDGMHEAVVSIEKINIVKFIFNN